MNEREKKQQRIYDLLNAETKPKYSKLRKIFLLQKKGFFKEKSGGKKD